MVFFFSKGSWIDHQDAIAHQVKGIPPTEPSLFASYGGEVHNVANHTDVRELRKAAEGKDTGPFDPWLQLLNSRLLGRDFVATKLASFTDSFKVISKKRFFLGFVESDS